VNNMDHINRARTLLETINQFATVGLNLAERISDSGGREKLIGELGQAAVDVLMSSGQRPMSLTDRPNVQAAEDETDAADWTESTAEQTGDEPRESAFNHLQQAVELERVQTAPNTYGPAFSGVIPQIMSAAPALMGAQMLLNAVQVIVETTEIHITERTKIIADRDVAIRQIDATREIISLYIERTFDERRENFDRLFAVLDRAQDDGSLEQMQLALTGILELVKTSPFKDFASFKKNWENPDTVWEL
jgi:hypothetical protein